MRDPVARKLKEKREFGRPKRRWEDNIIWIFRKWDGVHELDKSVLG